MNILLSLISSGAIKWLSILILVSGLVGGAYYQHRKIVDTEKQLALQQYNINQLEQNVKDKELFIEQQQTIFKNRDEEVEKNVKDKELYIRKMEEISIDKSKIINDLYNQNDALSEKAKEIEIIIEKDKATGKDRESSEILKDTFRELENMK
jgi:hypothetical protein